MTVRLVTSGFSDPWNCTLCSVAAQITRSAMPSRSSVCRGRAALLRSGSRSRAAFPGRVPPCPRRFRKSGPRVHRPRHREPCLAPDGFSVSTPATVLHLTVPVLGCVSASVPTPTLACEVMAPLGTSSSARVEAGRRMRAQRRTSSVAGAEIRRCDRCDVVPKGWLGVFDFDEFLSTVAHDLDFPREFEPAECFVFQFARPWVEFLFVRGHPDGDAPPLWGLAPHVSGKIALPAEVAAPELPLTSCAITAG